MASVAESSPSPLQGFKRYSSTITFPIRIIAHKTISIYQDGSIWLEIRGTNFKICFITSPALIFFYLGSVGGFKPGFTSNMHENRRI